MIENVCVVHLFHSKTKKFESAFLVKTWHNLTSHICTLHSDSDSGSDNYSPGTPQDPPDSGVAGGASAETSSGDSSRRSSVSSKDEAISSSSATSLSSRGVDGWVVSSESCAFTSIGANFHREILPGEIVEISPQGCGE